MCRFLLRTRVSSWSICLCYHHTVPTSLRSNIFHTFGVPSHLLLAPPSPAAQELLHSLPHPLSWPAWQRYHALAHRLFGFEGPPLPFSRFCTLSCERFGPGWRDQCVDQRDFDAFWQPMLRGCQAFIFPGNAAQQLACEALFEHLHRPISFNSWQVLYSRAHRRQPALLPLLSHHQLARLNWAHYGLAAKSPRTLLSADVLPGLPPLLVCCLLLLPAPSCLASAHGVGSAAAARLSAIF